MHKKILKRRIRYFDDLEKGDYIFVISGDFEIEKLVITKILRLSFESSLLIGTSESRTFRVGKYHRCSYDKIVYVCYKEACSYLKEKAKKRYLELRDDIDSKILEFEKLEKFLYDKKI